MQSETAPVPVDELWFKDCGLIIRAGDYVYRVSSDVLAMRSPVFRDMLGFPTPENEETLDGCPVVRLPDSSTDVTHFLRALYYYK
jgi:hypothetical protein